MSKLSWLSVELCQEAAQGCDCWDQGTCLGHAASNDVSAQESVLCVSLPGILGLKSGIRSASVECGVMVQINCTDPRRKSSLAHCTALGPPGTFYYFYRSTCTFSFPQIPVLCILRGCVGKKEIGNVVIKNCEEFDIPKDFILFLNCVLASTQKAFPVVCCSLYI